MVWKRKLPVILICLFLTAISLYIIYQTSRYYVNLKLYNAIESGNEESGKESIDNGAGKNSFHSLILTMESLNGRVDRNPVYADTILRNDNRIARYLMEKGANPNYKDKDGISLLMLASYLGNEDFCKMLIKEGADIKYKNKGASALDYVISSAEIQDSKKQIQLAEYLYGKGAPVTKITKKFIKHGYGFDGEVSPNWEKVMVWAIKKKIIKEKDLSEKQQYFYKISQGISFDKKVFQRKFKITDLYHVSGENIAMTAAKNGNVKLLKWAILNNVSLKEEDMGGNDILCLAVKSGDLNTVKYIIEQTKQSGEKIFECVCREVEYADQNIILYLVDQMKDLKYIPDDESILDEAVLAGRMELVKTLVEKKGMEPNGRTLENAVLSRNLKLTEYILDQGVDVDKIESYSDGSKSNSALTAAIQNGDFDMVEFLVKRGAKVKDAKEAIEDSESDRIKEYLKNFN